MRQTVVSPVFLAVKKIEIVKLNCTKEDVATYQRMKDIKHKITFFSQTDAMSFFKIKCQLSFS
jgi:hypothetical protein